MTAEIVSAAIGNTHWRDNLLETAPAKATAAGQTVFSTAANAIAMVTGAKYKTADESVNNSTVLQNDDHLSFAIAANEVWAFDMFLYLTIASGNPGLKTIWTFPASCTGWQQIVIIPANIGGFATFTGLNSAIGTETGFGLTGLTSCLLVFRGVFINSSTAGTIQFQWAQSAAVASNTTLKLGSNLDLTRLA